MAIVALGVFIGSLNAYAQAPKEKERQTLLEEARKAADADDHIRALALAARAAQIRMTTSVRAFIAEEEKAVGRLADAMNNADLCVREATENKALNEREKILNVCKKLIADLQRSSARVIISMFTRAPPDTEVTVNGNLIPESFFGLPYYVTPGNIRVGANAPGYAGFQRDLTVGPGEEVTVTVVLARSSGLGQGTKTPEPAPEAVSAQPENRSASQIGPYVVMGAGAVSLGASALFLIARNNAVSSLEAQCDPQNRRLCPDTAKVGSLREQVSTNNTLTNVTMIVGAAALVGGGVWWLLDRTQWLGSSRATLQIAPTPGGAMVAIAGEL